MTIRRVAHALLLWTLTCIAFPAVADSLARIVRLSYVDGDVRMDRGAGRGFERAVMNMPVVQGNQLETQDHATAEVEFEEGSTLRLIPNSAVTFQQLGRLDSGERVSVIDLLDGTAYLEAARKTDALVLASGKQQIVMTHPARMRVTRHGSEIRFVVLKGDVDVQMEDGGVRVKKGQTYALDLNDASHYYLAKGVDPEPYDDWDQQRDQYRETYAANHHDGYNSLYNYGWSDLNYFGGFFDYAGYGTLWRPFGMSPSWDPFGDGGWMFYPSYGYMWISGYPWGWMPYRYGSWVNVPTYGWCWQPGMYWNSWYAMPPMYGAPAGYVGPHPPLLAANAITQPTLAVGKGLMNGVQDGRYQSWMQARAQAPGMALPGKSQVTPLSTQPTAAASMTRTTTMASFRAPSAATASGATFRSHTFSRAYGMGSEAGYSGGGYGGGHSSGMSSGGSSGGASRSSRGGEGGMSGGGGGSSRGGGGGGGGGSRGGGSSHK